MNPMVYMTATLFFEVRNSEMFGGKDTVGYAELEVKGVKGPEQIDDAFILMQRESVAGQFGVCVEDVALMSKEAFDEAANDDE